MAEVDSETLERVRRWCAEAGRQAGAAEIRAALLPLSWDELLRLEALLADPPPARPLGPRALADLARGAPADAAAEREREGRYREELDAAFSKEAAPSEAGPGPRRRRAKGATPPVVHHRRAQSPAAPPPPPPPSPPPLRALEEPSGRVLLEGLVRRHGARRAAILGELAAYRREDGTAPGPADLDALLDHHGLSRGFAHREREELLHALRAARGEQRAAAARLGLDGKVYLASLERLGATQEAERIREERRAELRARATLAERCRLLAREPALLADLGLLDEFEADLSARLPEHLRALRAGRPEAALSEAFARTVGLHPTSALSLAQRLGLDLGRARGPRPPAHPGRAGLARRGRAPSPPRAGAAAGVGRRAGSRGPSARRPR